MRTLFLNPPSFEGFDGGAGSRYQARREIRSFWYPTWLAQPAALVPDSRLVDAPARGLSLEDVRPLARDYELAVLHTSTPSFHADVQVAEALKAENPALMLGFVGAHVAVSSEASLLASDAIDFVAGKEFDFTIKEIAEGRALSEVDGITWKKDGQAIRNPERAILHDMDQLPFVTPVYKRDLVPEDYFQGYLLHPYMSIYTGRGCKSRCTFCLWPQTIGGHKYRTRSAGHVIDEIALAKNLFPQVREFFFDDDTFTDDPAHAEEIARGLGRLGVTWSCTAKANVRYETLKVLRDNGLRLFLVGYETGNQQILYNIKKGMRIDVARRFTEDCHKLGITIHGTFIVGLPGETRETIEQTIRFAKEMNPHTIQVSLAAPYPGTYLYDQALKNGWLVASGDDLLQHGKGFQISSLSYPDLSQEEIFEAVAMFYRRFYFRPRKIAEILLDMVQSWDVTKRRLREGVEFMHFLRARETGS
jgi:hopanoid biosynthesis associated radical SAM protein HpnJ